MERGLGITSIRVIDYTRALGERVSEMSQYIIINITKQLSLCLFMSLYMSSVNAVAHRYFQHRGLGVKW